jgi:phage terminase large subunit GpA-like protein
MMEQQQQELLTPEALARLDAIDVELEALWAPPPLLKVSEWAEQNIFLRKGTTARPGQLQIEPYQREIMDAMCDCEVAGVVCRKCTQIGWSLILNAVAGYFICCDPKPVMMIQPTHQNAKDYSKKRIAPLIEDCPALKDRIAQNVSRKGGNTTLLKEFPGGFFKLTGANSGAALRSDPVPVLLFDEIDAYPHDVDGEGDPIKIAEKRSGQWDDAKSFKGSTPGEPKGISRIDEEYDKGSQGLFHVPCPHCGFEQALWWRDPETQEYRLVYEVDALGLPKRDSIRYVCKSCRGSILEQKHKNSMLRAGRWVHKYPERLVKSYHINALYSPWKLNWHTLATEWVEAQDKPEKLKTFINLNLGETWDEGGVTFDRNALVERKECYKPGASEDEQQEIVVPEAVAVLVASVDVQHNRLELQVTGFGAEEEQWLINHEQVMGDPGQPEVWRELDDWLLTAYPRVGGGEMLPVITLIDSGSGGHADSVYKFTELRQNTRRRVYACKGFDFLSKPGLAVRGTTKKQNVIVWNVATYAAKDRIISRLKKAQPGPGFMHFPMWTTEEYFDQLTAEKKITRVDRRTRRLRSEYVQTHPRNEALDLTVYAHAALYILQKHVDRATYADLGALAQSLQGIIRPPKPRGRRIRSQGIQV